MPSLSQTIEDLYRLIASRTGLVLNDHHFSTISGAVDRLVDSAKVANPDELLDVLLANPVTHPLWQAFIHAITVGETYFFRNLPQFDALRTQILPSLIEARRKAGNKHLRLWSAGCATGEEPYSLAILLRDLIPDIETWSITVLATDINDDYLAQARRGIYRPRSFRNETPSDLSARWFTKTGEGYKLHSLVRNMVLFKPLNLVSEEYPAIENNTTYMDLIFCRNVTIYFERETTRQIAQRFKQALNPEGWLVVGHSEPQADLYHGFVARNFKDTVLYQKAAEEAVPAAPMLVQPLEYVAPPPRPLTIRRVEAPRPAAPPVAAPAAPRPSVETCWAHAKAAADLEKWDEARAWLDQAEEQDAFQPQVHYLRALIELHAQQVERSLQLLRRAVYCDGRFALAHYLLGELYHQRDASRDARRHWQLALDAVAQHDSAQVLPYSDDLTAEMLVELLVDRLVKVS